MPETPRPKSLDSACGVWFRVQVGLTVDTVSPLGLNTCTRDLKEKRFILLTLLVYDGGPREINPFR